MRLTTPKTAAPGGGVEPAVRFDFLSSDEVRGQGMSLFPAATPPTVNNGLVLNGASQYATVPLTQIVQAFQGGVSGQLTEYVEFFPDFNYTEAVDRALFDCIAPNRYIIYKSAVGPAYFLHFYAGATTLIASIDSAVYGALWRTGGKNRIAAALSNGNSVFFLNGAVIGGSAVAWGRVLPSNMMTIGATNGPLNLFDGVITDLRLYSRMLTNAEGIELTTLT